MPQYDKQPNKVTIRKENQSSLGYFRRQKWTGILQAAADAFLDDQATSDSVATTVTEFDAQPDFPRNVTITPGGTTTDVAAGNYVITGTNIRDEVITETIAIAANASTLQAGAKAFKTITSILFPIQDGAAATFDVGFGDKMGLDRCMDGNEVLYATVAGVYETTRPTVVGDADEVEKNTVDTNTAMNASNLVVGFIASEVTSNRASTA